MTCNQIPQKRLINHKITKNRSPKLWFLYSYEFESIIKIERESLEVTKITLSAVMTNLPTIQIKLM